MSSDTLRVVGISGSLRKASFNTMALKAAIELAPADMSFEIGEIGDLPLYNGDVHQVGYPAAAQRLVDQLAKADAIVFATPEYNYSTTGALKNAIDWVSRAQPTQPFNGKAVAIMGASMGALGSARAQYQLRQMLIFINAHPINKPEVMIGTAQSKFDADGKLIDQPTRDLIAQMMTNLGAFARQLKK